MRAVLDKLRRREHLPLALVLVLSVVLNLVGITWGLPHYTDWAQDSIALSMSGAARFFSHGWYDKYPPVHYAILAILYAPYIAYLWFSGELTALSKTFPYGLTDPLTGLTHVILIARAVSVLMGVGIVFLVYVTVRELFDRRSALFAALTVTLYYPLVYYAHNANVEVPYLFWALLAMYYFLHVLKYGHLKHYVLFALFGIMSICTKDQAYGLFIFSPMLILWARYTELDRVSLQRPSFWSVLFDRRFLTAALVAIATFAVAYNFLFNFSGFLSHVDHITGRWQPYASQAPTLLGRLQLLWENTTTLASTLTPPLFGLCVLGSVYCAFRFPRHALPLLLFAVSYYLTFINVIRYSFLRVTLPLGIILAFFGGKLIAELWGIERGQRLIRPAICLVFAYAAFAVIQLDILFLHESRYAAERWMQQHFLAGSIVETYEPKYHLLYWFYPRFPSWVKVRNSTFEAGPQWAPQPIKRDKIRLPNLYFGREAPDYVVLKMLSDEKRAPLERIRRYFFEGHSGYTLLATFRTPTVIPIRLPINPRIDIFGKTHPPAVSSEISP